MIDIADHLPRGVVVAEASGRVTEDDYESALVPAVVAAAESGRPVRLLYVLGDAFEGYDLGAALDDARLGMQHWGDFERIGLVTDHDVYRTAARTFGFLMPGEVRVFEMAALPEARTWVLEGRT